MKNPTLLDFTPQDFLEIYLRNGLRPTSGHVSIKNNACCGLGAWAMDLGIKDIHHGTIRGYVEAWYIGFDAGILGHLPLAVKGAGYQHGYDVGKYLRENFPKNPKGI